jgi:hypothetical protein
MKKWNSSWRTRKAAFILSARSAERSEARSPAGSDGGTESPAAHLMPERRPGKDAPGRSALDGERVARFCRRHAFGGLRPARSKSRTPLSVNTAFS